MPYASVVRQVSHPRIRLGTSRINRSSPATPPYLTGRAKHSTGRSASLHLSHGSTSPMAAKRGNRLVAAALKKPMSVQQCRFYHARTVNAPTSRAVPILVR